MQPTDFAKALSHYLAHHLPGQRNLSQNTIRSYRDTFKLLLIYCQQFCDLSIEHLCLKHLDQSLILGFLSWLEQDRKNSVSTRNQRLAGLHGFFRYMQTEDPVGLFSYQKILSVPMKKAPKPSVNHLLPEALKLILEQPDLTKVGGRRDSTLLSVLYDSGARVQELIDLKVADVRVDCQPIITLTGKGRKTRQVPLMAPTTLLLKRYMIEHRLFQSNIHRHPLFFNRQRKKMTRAGVSFILNKYATQARAKSTMVPDKVTPHVLRHTKAMLLLQAGVSLIYIRDLLGHTDITTTEIYARTDTELKRKALEKAYPDLVSTELPDWHKDESLLAWLTRL